MTAGAIHAVFDILAWAVALTTFLVLRRTWFPVSPVAGDLRFGYLAALIAGAGLGAWAAGTLNLWLSDMPGFGRSVIGALAGAILAIELYKKASGISVRTGAVYALPVALGIAVGRIGCLLSGLEDFTHGVATGASWGWDFGDGIPRHPAQLYETVAMTGFAMVYIGMMVKGSRFWRVNGFYLVVGFYGIERFAIEYFKPYGALGLGLTVFQFLCVALIVYAVLMIRGNSGAGRTSVIRAPG